MPILGHTQAGIHLVHLYRSKSEQASPSCNYAQQIETRVWFEDETNQPPEMPISFHQPYCESPLDATRFQTLKVTISSYNECHRDTELNYSYPCPPAPNMITTSMPQPSAPWQCQSCLWIE